MTETYIVCRCGQSAPRASYKPCGECGDVVPGAVAAARRRAAR